MIQNKNLVIRFIEQLWNNKNFSMIDQFLHPEYQDHSLLPSIPKTSEGLKRWIENTSLAFEHHTDIESIVSEGDEVAVRIRFSVKHIGTWRGMEPTGAQASIKGFRFFRIKEGKIVEQHALIDGEALQTALTNVYKGCEIPTPTS